LHSRHISLRMSLSQVPFRYVSDTCRPASYRRGYRCVQWTFICTLEQVFHKSPIAVFRIRSFPATRVKDEVRLQPRRRRALAHVAARARPRVVLWSDHHPRSHRIEMHRAGTFHSIGVSLDQDCLVSALEQMARPLPFDVEIRRVCTIDVPHDLRKVARWCFQQQVIMVAHQAPGMHDRSIPHDCRFHLCEKPFPIFLALKDVLLFIASRCDMVECTRIFDS
jgi:hypothetical protein